MPDWVIVVIVGAIVIFGANKLPELARNLGRSSGEFKRGLKEGDDEAARATTPDAPVSSPTPTPPAAAPTDQASNPNETRPGSTP